MKTSPFPGLVLVLLAVVAGGCGGGGDEEGSEGKAPPRGQNFAAEDLKRFLVKESDLPSGYEETERESGPTGGFVKSAQTSQQQSTYKRIAAPGLEDFSTVSYRKGEGENHNGPGSLALRYRSSKAASKALPTVTKYFGDNTGFTGAAEPEPAKKIRGTRLGDKASGLRVAVGPYAVFFYIWRERNVVASLGGGDILGDMSAKTVLEMAKKINSRATR